MVGGEASHLPKCWAEGMGLVFLSVGGGSGEFRVSRCRSKHLSPSGVHFPQARLHENKTIFNRTLRRILGI